MNSPTIAALVPGLKPQTERSAVSSDLDAAQGGSFADVLAEQASPARDGAHTDRTSNVGADAASGEQSGNGAELNESNIGEAAVELIGDDKAEGMASALPQIALEIALHARDQARSKSVSVETERQSGDRAIRLDRPDPLTTSMRANATLVHTKSLEANTDAAPEAFRGSNGNSAYSLGQSLPSMAALTGRPGLSRLATHQTDLKPAASATALQDRTATRAPADGAGKAATPRAIFDTTLNVAVQNQTGLIDSAIHEERLHSVDPHSAAQSSSASFNPFSAPAGATNASSAGSAVAITTPVHQPGWNTDFSRQVIMLARDAHSGTQTAELRLDPPELGPLRITLSLNDGMASALFVSAHASVRQAVEAALPQLSQQLAEAGISLGEAHVGDQGQAGFASSEGGNDRGLSGKKAASDGNGPADIASAPRRTVAANALVDTFA